MKVISEHTIKQLIKHKLVENYKKKLLTEQDSNATSFSEIDKQQIIASGVIESIYVYLNDPKYNNDVGITLNLKKTELNNALNGILKSKTFGEFKQNISNLKSGLNEVLNSFAFFVISDNPLFTKLLANEQEILQNFQKLMPQIILQQAFSKKSNDLIMISNHTNPSPDNSYQWVSKQITDNIDKLLQKDPTKLNNEQIKQKLGNLLSVINMDINNNKKVTNAESVIDDFDLGDHFNLSAKQKEKIAKYVDQNADAATDNKEENAEYRQLLADLFQIRFLDKLPQDQRAKVASQIIQQTGLSPQQTQDATKTVAAVAEALENEKTKENKSEIEQYKPTQKDIFKLPIFGTKDSATARFKKLLKYITSSEQLLNLQNKKIGFIHKTEREIDQYIAALRTPRIQYGNISLGGYTSQIFKDLQSKLKIMGEVNNKNTSADITKLETYVADYFDNKALLNSHYIIIDENFINYLHLRILQDIANLETVPTEIKKFKKNNTINKKPEIPQTADTNNTTTPTSTIDPKAKSTSKKHFATNQGDTNDFRLLTISDAHGFAKKLVNKNKLQGVADYFVLMGYLLLNPSAVPSGYGFINKQEKEKNEIASKLNTFKLDKNQIATIIDKLYADKKWQATHFININVDEIIANR